MKQVKKKKKTGNSGKHHKLLVQDVFAGQIDEKLRRRDELDRFLFNFAVYCGCLNEPRIGTVVDVVGGRVPVSTRVIHTNLVTHDNGGRAP